VSIVHSPLPLSVMEASSVSYALRYGCFLVLGLSKSAAAHRATRSHDGSARLVLRWGQHKSKIASGMAIAKVVCVGEGSQKPGACWGGLFAEGRVVQISLREWATWAV
jgi:hypothetical protein